MRFSRAFLFLSALVSGLAGLPVVAAEGPSSLVWLEREGPAWQASAGEPATANAELTAHRWFPPLPSTSVQKSDLTPIALRELGAGRMRVLAFWATWCEPCKKELPALDALALAHREQGVEFYAVNVDEPRALALTYMAAVGVGLPVILADRATAEALDIRQMPTLILADAEGRIRARWSGYRDDLIGDLERGIVELSAEIADPPPPERLATVELGAGMLETMWARDSSGDVTALATHRSAAGETLVAAGRTLVAFSPEGSVVRSGETRFVPTKLIPLDVDADGTDELAGWRPGGRRLVVFDESFEVAHDASIESPVFDACPAGTGRLAVATMDGIRRVSFEDDGAVTEKVTDSGLVRALTRLGGDGGARYAALDAESLTWLSESFEPVGSPNDASATTLVNGGRGGGVGLAAPGVIGVSAQLTSEGAGLIAIYADERLRLIDPRSGEERFRAHWPEVSALAAADIDGDGRDELAVATSRRVVALRVSGEGDP